MSIRLPITTSKHVLSNNVRKRIMAATDLIFVAALALSLSACGASSVSAPAASADVPQEAVARADGITIRANTVRTIALNEATAKQYGIERRNDTVMLLVAVRQGPDGQETALPAEVTAKASDLLGQPRTLSMREVRSGEWVDYLGTIEVTSPTTLRFDLAIKHANGATTDMQFTRDF